MCRNNAAMAATMRTASPAAALSGASMASRPGPTTPGSGRPVSDSSRKPSSNASLLPHARYRVCTVTPARAAIAATVAPV